MPKISREEFERLEKKSIDNRIKVLLNKRRVCGACNLCCTVLGVEELLKPCHTRCTHLSDEVTTRSCKVYADRPTSCKQFNCAWRYDMVGEQDDRPDKIGVIFDGANALDCAWFVAWIVGEKPTVRGMTLIKMLAQKHPVLVRFQGTGQAKLMAEPWVLAKMPNLLKALDMKYANPLPWEVKARELHDTNKE